VYISNITGTSTFIINSLSVICEMILIYRVNYALLMLCMYDRKSRNLQQDMHSVTTRLKSITSTVEKVHWA